ncbi:MAG TPA: LytTR family transcriptional regulator, partial [Clostridiales bacterium]|nr:LytTR family transcriptional regulator [Clostridiales bacterium]
SGFIRISKSVLVNLKYLDCVEPSFGGIMLLVLKNGCKDYISRKYLTGPNKTDRVRSC